MKESYLQIVHPDYVDTDHISEDREEVKSLYRISILDPEDGKFEVLLFSLSKNLKSKEKIALDALGVLFNASRYGVIKTLCASEIDEFLSAILDSNSEDSVDAFRALRSLCRAARRGNISFSNVPFGYIGILCRKSVSQDYARTKGKFDSEKWRAYWLEKRSTIDGKEISVLTEFNNLLINSVPEAELFLIYLCYPDVGLAFDKALKKASFGGNVFINFDFAEAAHKELIKGKKNVSPLINELISSLQES